MSAGINEDLEFLNKHRGKSALLDTNLLLVYVVGKARPRLLPRFHHTKQYERDFPAIRWLVEIFFRTIYTTPNILTEVSNLGGKLGAEFFGTLAKVVEVLEERYCVSKQATVNPHFAKLGLTDACLCSLAANHLIVTLDFALYQVLRANKVEVVNFHHLRPSLWK